MQFLHYYLLIFSAALIVEPVIAMPDCSENFFYTDKDHPLADDNNSGVEDFPFESIQRLVNVLGYCVEQQRVEKIGRVKYSNLPYQEIIKSSGVDLGGITFTKGGFSATERLVVEGINGNGGRPIINQGLFYILSNGTPVPSSDIASVSGEQPVAGFNVAHSGTGPANHITIRNFEITQTSTSGINIETGHENLDILVENNYIHHIFGAENVGGVKLNDCHECIVRNNTIHDIYDTRRSSNRLNSMPYGLHSGVHGFWPGNCLVENNLIYNVGKGVFLKQPNDDDLDAHHVRRNIFFNVAQGAYQLEIAGAGSPGAQNAEFYDNIVYDAAFAVELDERGASTQPHNLKIYNNTLVNVRGIANLARVSNVAIFNNIRSGTTTAFGTPTVDFQTISANTNSINFYDCNLYFQHANRWTLENDAGAPIEVTFTNLSNWQTSFTNGATGLNQNPDLNSNIQDPLFADPDNHDYSLQAGSWAIGNGCGPSDGNSYPTTLGAVRAGITIGPLNNLSPAQTIDTLQLQINP